MTLEITTSRNATSEETGFSLIELITVVVVVGVISIFAAAKFTESQEKIQYETAIHKIVSDVRLAQQLALSEGNGTRVYFDQSNNRYYLKWDDDTYVKTLVGDEDFVVQFGYGDFAAVSITNTELSNGRLDFATSGVPSNEGSTFTGELNVVTLNSAKKLQISANTGFLSVEDL